MEDITKSTPQVVTVEISSGKTEVDNPQV